MRRHPAATYSQFSVAVPIGRPSPRPTSVFPTRLVKTAPETLRCRWPFPRHGEDIIISRRRKLAEVASLTPRQAALGLRLVNKYRRQLGQELLARAKGEVAA